MSLNVPADLLDQARHGDVDDAAFAACIQASLPYAWQLIAGLAGNCTPLAPIAPTTRCRLRTRPPAASYSG